MALKKKTLKKAPLVKTKKVTKKVSPKKATASKKVLSKKVVAKPKKAIAKKVVVKKKAVVKSTKKTSLPLRVLPSKGIIKKAITPKKIVSKKKVVKPVVKTKKIASKKTTKKVLVTKKGASISLKKNKAPKKVVSPKLISKIIIAVKKKAIKKPILKKVIIPVKKAVVKPIKLEKKKIVVEKIKPVIVGAEKLVKIGVKTKKQLIAIEPMPVVEVSNFPKHKIKNILISQPQPENDKNPYSDLAKKYNLSFTFRQFIKIEGVPVKDFRAQRIDILEHKAVILTSRMSVDHYFRMCTEMRVTVPESMKYFCINEATAYYLQKYIQYRKRKIFFGHQTIQDLVDVIKKNREEKFLLPASDIQKEKICDFLDALNIRYTKAVMYSTVSANLTDIKNLNDYDALVLFTPSGVSSLKQNFPNFKQGNTRIGCFGPATGNTLKNKGYRLDIYAPNPKNPSMSSALEDYLKESNKR